MGLGGAGRKASISSAETGAEGRLEGGRVGVAVGPAVEAPGMEDDWHAVVYLRHQLVRVGGDDGVALQPQAVGEVEAEELLILGIEALPCSAAS